MIGVSARSYVAAGMATAITGAMVVVPVLAHTRGLPSLPSADVELSAFVSFTERKAAHAMDEATVGVSAVMEAVTRVESAQQGTISAAAGVTSNESSAGNAASAAVAPSATSHALNAAAVQGSNALNAAAATVASAPSLLQRIIAVPLLLSTIPVVVTAQALVTIGEDAGFGTVDVLAGLATGNTTEVQDGLKLIGDTVGDFLTATNNDIGALQKQVDAFGSGSASLASVAASSVRAGGAVTPGTAAVTKPAGAVDAAKADDTKGGSPLTSAPSKQGGHQTAPSSVTTAAKVSGATTTDAAAKTSGSSSTPSHVGQTSASGTSASAAKHATAGGKGHK